MKKTLAMILALCLSLTCFTAFAEEASEIPTVEVAAIEDGTVVPVGESGYTITLPADWTVAETPENYLMAAQKSDNTIAVFVNVAPNSLDDLWNQCQEAITAGTMLSINEAYLNDTYAMLASVDATTSAAYVGLDETTTMVIVFTVASDDVPNDAALQIIASVAAAE